MSTIPLDYAQPSEIQLDGAVQSIALQCDRARPLRWSARVAWPIVPLRLALEALGNVLWSEDSWNVRGRLPFRIPDPWLTIHSDRIFLEAYAQNHSAFAMVVVERELFETDGFETRGVTNVNFNGWFWWQLAELRSGIPVQVRVEPGDMPSRSAESHRQNDPAAPPDDWIRGLLQFHALAGRLGTRLRCRPVDVLNLVSFLKSTKRNVLPRALSFVLAPGHDAAIVVEPYGERIPLNGASHDTHQPSLIRTWGRRRLNVLEPLLPFADEVEIDLKGWGLPSLYVVKMPGVTFILGLTGWAPDRWRDKWAFDLLASPELDDTNLGERAQQALGRSATLDHVQLAAALAVEEPRARESLTWLSRRGLALYDPLDKAFLARELFPSPVDEARLYPPDNRRRECRRMITEASYQISRCEPCVIRRARRVLSRHGRFLYEAVFQNWDIGGIVDGKSGASTEVFVDDNEQIISGACGCSSEFQRQPLREPCAHMLVLREATAIQRREAASNLLLAAFGGD